MSLSDRKPRAMTNKRTQQQNLESSPSSAEPSRKRIRINNPLVFTSNIAATAMYQNIDHLSHE
ncbi:hypothetical protein BGX24_010737 [Mortierella sp. AD032]|nr:hypothetical protein BGX24_010737 [Mortierella sp. AD032]